MFVPKEISYLFRGTFVVVRLIIVDFTLFLGHKS